MLPDNKVCGNKKAQRILP